MIKKTFVISLGGSIIVPQGGIDVNFLKRFKKLVLEQVELGYKFIIITGGGTTAREYIKAGNKVSKMADNDSDWMGIAATRLNARLIQSIFGPVADSNIIIDPTMKVDSGKKVVIGAGYKPGRTTDYVAILCAKNAKADVVINLSNIDYVCDKDPGKYKDAKPLEKMTWKEFKDIVGDKHSPGMNAPFDPIASKLAAKEKTEVVIVNGRKIDNVRKYLEGEKFKGTVIS